MKYRFYQEQFTWLEVEEIMRNRLESWLKQVRSADQAGMDTRSLEAMKYILGVYLGDYVSFRVNRLGQFEETELERLAREELEK